MIQVYGDVFLDQYIVGRSTRLSAEVPVPVTDVDGIKYVPGGAQTVARVIRSCGCPATVSSHMSQIVKTRLITNEMQTARIDFQPRGRYVSNAEHEIVKEDTIAIVVVDYDYGSVDRQLVETLKGSGLPIFCDAKYDFSKFVGCTAIKSNRSEFETYFKTSLDDPDWQDVVKKARNTLEVQYLVITLGRNGAILCSEEECIKVPTQQMTEVDVTGAGDVFMGVFVYERMQTNTSAKQAVATACRIASEFVKVPKYPTEQTVVFTNGCFDILHPGHINTLRSCRFYGTRVIVGLNSDESIKRLKGESRPIMPQEYRKMMLEALPFVDEVIIFDDDTPEKLIEQINPDIIVKGEEYKGKEVVGSKGRKVIYTRMIDGISTSAIVNAIKKEQ